MDVSRTKASRRPNWHFQAPMEVPILAPPGPGKGVSSLVQVEVLVFSASMSQDHACRSNQNN